MGRLLEFFRLRLGRDPFSVLVGPHLLHLYRVGYRFTGKREDAEDLVQALLLRLYPRRNELHQIADLRQWLVRALYNLFIDTIRRSARDPLEGAAGDEALCALQDPGPGPETSVEHGRLQARIAEALARLDVDQRVVVTLHDMEGYNLSELAKLLDLPLGTVKSRLHRGRNRLREAWKGEPFAVADRVSRQR
jgi:RNA polymerase sigma-70 factor (ECF subfamily)